MTAQKISATERTRLWLAALSPEEREAFRQRKNAKSRQKRLENPELFMWRAAKRRAASQGLPFTLKVSDIKIPTHCPVLGIALIPGSRMSPNSPSLDRIKPRLGYVRGNVMVVSWRVNQIKSDATFAEIKAIAEFYRL